MPPLSYNTPRCPDSIGPRRAGTKHCPRSDTYRAIESGNAQAIFGWLFRCRTCGTMFFRASRELGMAGVRAGQRERLMRNQS